MGEDQGDNFGKDFGALIGRFGETRRAREISAVRGREEQQKFLSALEKVMRNEVLPAMEDAAGYSTETVSVHSNYDETAKVATLTFGVQMNSPSRDVVRLEYRGDYRRERVIVSVAVQGTYPKPNNEEDFDLSEITKDHVRARIMGVLKDMAKVNKL